MKNSGRKFVVLLLVYLMVIGTLIGIIFSNKDITSSTQNKIIAGIVVLAISLVYWVAFYIIDRRNKQRR